MLRNLVLKNRSYRGFDESVRISRWKGLWIARGFVLRV